LPNYLRVFVKSQREKALLSRNPWVFSGSLSSAEKGIGVGDIVDVCSHNGGFTGRGFYNPNTDIAVRFLTFTDEPTDRNFFKRRIDSAVALRRATIGSDTDTYRVINGEGDFLPGLIVDKYANTLVCQFLCAGMDKIKTDIVDILKESLSPIAIHIDNSPHSRKLERLAGDSLTVLGEVSEIEVMENGHKFSVHPLESQKTGMFIDQRENRQYCANLARHCQKGADIFCYTGAFGIYMLSAGLEGCDLVDVSQKALTVAQQNLALNGIAEDRFTTVKSDAFSFLSNCDRNYNIIVLDPPALAKKRDDVIPASRAYKELNMKAMSALSPGGFLCTFSCSPHIDFKLFSQIVYSAASDAKIDARIIRKFHQGSDHPQLLSHIEGEYLKGFFVQIF
jgi:23S rRNA (cytosine1962-C5)-methyltransferase